MNGLRSGHAESIVHLAEQKGLRAALLYEAVMDLAAEGMLTAHGINAAARLLLEDFGLPRYYFRTLSKAALMSALRTVARNLDWDPQGGCRLSDRAAYVEESGHRGILVYVANEANRAAMEAVAGRRMLRRRWEYYRASETGYTTTIVKPEECPPLAAVEAGASPFAFASVEPGNEFTVPLETGDRYRDFLRRQEATASRLVEFSAASETGETRIMFHKNIAFLYLPVIRRLLDTHGLMLTRAYGEPYRTRIGSTASVCSFYVGGPLDAGLAAAVAGDLRAFLALGENPFAEAFLDGRLGFAEMVFAANLAFFVHQFIHRDNQADRRIMASLESQELRDALAKRINDANRSEYTRRLVQETFLAHPERVRELHALFDLRLNPRHAGSSRAGEIPDLVRRFERGVALAFVEDTTGHEIMRFAARLVTQTLKTNFFRRDKRSFAFRLDPAVLDPVVFPDPVAGLFFVLGHYSLGTHMRAETVARGGLRLLRVTEANYENRLDDANLLNYALGPKAQHRKHKDIAEGGAKGVVVPTPTHAGDALNAMYDYCDGLLDLALPDPGVGEGSAAGEMFFFGPDEGTAPLMDAVAARARVRGYPYWRTIATGKSIGIPHDAYGLTEDGRAFGLIGRGKAGTELQLEGQPSLTTADPDAIVELLKLPAATSGMTTTGVMACFRTLLQRLGMREEDTALAMTGGPDGDLGANQIQCFRGRICLVVDGGGVLFDPDGLDRQALWRLAVSRHTRPRLNAADYPAERLGPRGFLVRRTDAEVVLPGGVRIESGAYFHGSVLGDPASRDFMAAAGIQAFIPCGGLKDTINFANVRDFLAVFRELRVIVEGANVFFDDAARDVIAAESSILQIRDSTANKGGVTCSALSEVLSAFLLGDDYERVLVEDAAAKYRLVRELLELVRANGEAETRMLLNLHAADPSQSLPRLSLLTSDRLLAFQARLRSMLGAILADGDLVRRVVLAYVPASLTAALGAEAVVERLNLPPLCGYRDAIVTKKLAALAVYAHAAEWQAFQAGFEADPRGVLRRLAAVS